MCVGLIKRTIWYGFTDVPIDCLPNGEMESIRICNTPSKARLFIWGAVVEVIKIIFERKNDATIYIPAFYPTL